MFGLLNRLLRSTRLPPVSWLRCLYSHCAANLSLSMLHVPTSSANKLPARARVQQSFWSILGSASYRLATEQLLCHIVRGGVLHRRQNIGPLLIACLMKYAMRFTTHLYINNPSQTRSLFSTRMVAFSCTWRKQLSCQLSMTDQTKPLVSSPYLRRQLVYFLSLTVWMIRINPGSLALVLLAAYIS